MPGRSISSSESLSAAFCVLLAPRSFVDDLTPAKLFWPFLVFLPIPSVSLFSSKFALLLSLLSCPVVWLTTVFLKSSRASPLVSDVTLLSRRCYRCRCRPLLLLLLSSSPPWLSLTSSSLSELLLLLIALFSTFFICRIHSFASSIKFASLHSWIRYFRHYKFSG